MAKRKRYDDKFRASAVVMLEAAGYPNNKGALARTSQHVGVPYQTLLRWYNAQQNPPPYDLVHEKKEELADVFERVAYKYLAHAEKDEQVGDTGSKDAVIIAATAVDKMRLLRGLPTEIIELIPGVLAAIDKMGLEASDVFNGIIQRAARMDS